MRDTVSWNLTLDASFGVNLTDTGSDNTSYNRAGATESESSSETGNYELDLYANIQYTYDEVGSDAQVQGNNRKESAWILAATGSNNVTYAEDGAYNTSKNSATATTPASSSTSVSGTFVLTASSNGTTQPDASGLVRK